MTQVSPCCNLGQKSNVEREANTVQISRYLTVPLTLAAAVVMGLVGPGEMKAQGAESADARVAKAQELFAEGKKLFVEGKKDAARREFDKAVDLLLQVSPEGPERAKLERKLEELIDRIYHYDLEAVGSNPNQDPAFDKSPLDEIREVTFPTDPRLKTKVLEEIEKTQSQLPLTVNDPVIGFINYFNTERGRRTLVYGLKRAGKYKEMISRILAEEGVPQELVFLAQAESGFLPRAVSYMAAVGMWQFVQFRGREYGLMQSAWHDDRLDPEKATRAAARHLRDLYRELGDWYLALAAYNCGPGCVAAAVQRTGYADYWELHARRALPRETANYVPIILAMTIMTKNAKDYGLENLVLEPPVEYESVRLESNTSIQLAADAADVPLTSIKELNPALLHGIAPQFYELRVPKGSGEAVAKLIAQVPAEKRTVWRLHHVSESDTVEALAKTYRTTPSEILAKNTLTVGASLSPESVLVMPSAPEPPRVAYRWVWVKGRRVAVPVNAPGAAAAVKPAAKAPAVTAPKPGVKPTASAAPAKKPMAKSAVPALHAKRPARS